MVVIGIDLGTTSSCVAVWDNIDVVVIANEHGNKTTPSYVAFTRTQLLTGEDAKNQASSNPLNTIFGTKLLIGRRYDDIAVQKAIRNFSYRLKNDNGMPKILVNYKDRKMAFAPEEICGMILNKMKQVAETYLGKAVSDAVITVPAYFNDAQRCATRTAGALAGLNVLRIINEPTAAALAYCLDRNLKEDRNVLVYDLGGGTFDVSLVTISEGAIYELKATNGNPRLGGKYFDNRIVAYFIDDFHKRLGKKLSKNRNARRRLQTASERAKRILSSTMVAIVELEALHDGIDYNGRITREMFEELCLDLFHGTLFCVDKTLKDAKMTKKSVNDVILVGGSSRIHKVRAMLQDYFHGKSLTCCITPDEVVAYGAAIKAAVIAGENLQKIQELLLVDIVPLSLGIETLKGTMLKVIDRNTVIPCCNTKEVTTLYDYQRAITLEVYEGERSLTKRNNLLGVFELTGIPPAPRGVAKVDVTFNVDVNGILTVSAQDRINGNMKSIVIENEHRLKHDEIEKMLSDAERFREEDREIKHCLEVGNQLEIYINDVMNTVMEKPISLTEEEKKIMLREIQDALLCLETDMKCLTEQYEGKITELLSRWSEIVKKFYDQNWMHEIMKERTEHQPLTQVDGCEQVKKEEIPES